MMKHSKTTESLMTSLNRLKEDKKEITEKLKENIIKNHDYFQQHSLDSRKYNLKLIVKRERSIQILQKKLHNKKKMDQYNDLKLSEAEKINERKKQQLEKKLGQINNRNSQRIKELTLFQEKVIKKMQEGIQKNQIKEKHLKEQYNRLKGQEKKINQIKIGQKKQATEQWRVLQTEKWRLQQLALEHQQRQQKLIRDKNPIANKIEDKKKNEDKNIYSQKQKQRIKNPLKLLDAKQIGKQYMEQVKSLHRQFQTKKIKKKLMNINLKVIGYTSDVMEKIYRNTSDLSKFKPAIDQISPIVEIPLAEIAPQPITLQANDYNLVDDSETQKYLQQIKQNLSQLQKINKKKGNPEIDFNETGSLVKQIEQNNPEKETVN